MRITKRLVIRGRVQGVWFRESMRFQAEALNVAGWVRNRRDGTVEAMVQGEEEAVEALIAWSRRGPDAAQVDQVEVTEGSGEFTAFERRETA
jgi:acylphosphatase